MESTPNTRKWDTIAPGTRVKILTEARQLRRDAAGNFVKDAAGEYVVDEFGTGLEGVVVNVTNAGFRGNEMSVRTDEGLYLPGFSAAKLQVL